MSAGFIQERAARWTELDDLVTLAEDLGLHTLFVGEVLDVKGDPAMVEDGRLDIEKIRPPIYDPARNRYFGVGKYLARAFRAGKKLAP